MERAKVKAIRERIQNVLDEAGFEDIDVKVGNASFGSGYATFKLNVSSVTADGNLVTKEAQDFKTYARLYDLKPEDLGRTFNQGRDVYEIVGAKPRSRKYPILAKNVDTGTVYKFSADMVALKLSIAS